MSRLHPLTLLAFWLCVFHSSAASAQTLGGWNLLPPDSAALISGGGSHYDWINTEDAFITLEQALTSWPIDQQGYANPDTNSVFQVDYAGGVRNSYGEDLVMLDATFDRGIYTVYSDYDGYTAGLTVDMARATIVSDHDYYNGGAGPWNAKVRAVEIDLSNLGVPADHVISSMRFECADHRCDPLALARIERGVYLDIVGYVAGQTATVTVSNATPSGLVAVALSLAGNAPTLVGTGACGSLVMDLQFPITVIGQGAADGAGTFAMTATVPAGSVGRMVYLQAVDATTCELSNGLSVKIR